MIGWFFVLLIVLVVVCSYLGASRSRKIVGGELASLHSRPLYHGGYLTIFTVLPALVLMALYAVTSGSFLDGLVTSKFSAQLSELSLPQAEAFLRDAKLAAQGGAFAERASEITKEAAVYLSSQRTLYNGAAVAICSAIAAFGFWFAWSRIAAPLRARHLVERVTLYFLLACSAVAILTTIGIVFSLIFESLRFFQKVPFFDFLFGIHWSPQSAFESANVDPAEIAARNGEVFGAIPLFAGTLLITLIAMLVAAPVGLMSAIYLSDYASQRFRSIAKPIMEVLAGIPTVVYGFFAALTVAPFFRGWGEAVGLSVASESALAAGVVMGIMIIPFVSSLSDDVINSVPQSLRDASAGLGATKSETIRKVVLPAALPGIVSSMLLAVSRAIGETMIVVMAAGLAANLTINPLEAVTTVTVQIVTLLVGDQEFDSAKTLAAFALGLVLFCITLVLNVIALRVVQKYREQYD